MWGRLASGQSSSDQRLGSYQLRCLTQEGDIFLRAFTREIRLVRVWFTMERDQGIRSISPPSIHIDSDPSVRYSYAYTMLAWDPRLGDRHLILPRMLVYSTGARSVESPRRAQSVSHEIGQNHSPCACGGKVINSLSTGPHARPLIGYPGCHSHGTTQNPSCKLFQLVTSSQMRPSSPNGGSWPVVMEALPLASRTFRLVGPDPSTSLPALGLLGWMVQDGTDRMECVRYTPITICGYGPIATLRPRLLGANNLNCVVIPRLTDAFSHCLLAVTNI